MARTKRGRSSSTKTATIKEEPSHPMEIKDFEGKTVANLHKELVKTIKDTVAQGATDSELYYLFQVASMYGLNPLLKEIWFAKMDGKVAIMTSRDGYLKIAKKNSNYKKVQSMAVYQNDTFLTKMVDGEVVSVTHEFGHIDRGHLVGAYAFLKSKDGEEDIFAYKDFREYNKKNKVWNGYPTAMIRKVAEVDVLKRFANISGIVTSEEMGEENLTENYEYTDDVEIVDVVDDSDIVDQQQDDDVTVEEVEE